MPRPASAAPYPDAPWRLHGSMWLTTFWLDGRRHPTGRSGVVGAAWVDYREPSPLTYRELLLAVPTGLTRGLRVRVEDIWVDSPASLAGGRDLWAIPKGLADFTVLLGREPSRSAHWSVRVDGQPVARARFRDLPLPAPRAPYAFSTRQPPLDGTGGDVVAPVRGTARVRPCRARWQVETDGPLGRLAGARPLASVRLEGFALSFG